ncbi:MAG: type VII secretion integral membrane protein EccD [Actinobacteria bacterium]|nr:type VII secretion integral membrane protein EccD [Actinomycetota bacterium]MBI3687213.1 type VII secretion integral membrane protein EccD [Actinomycetota bacterium]
MSSNAGVGLCRVTVIAPHSRVDVALPIDVPLAELLPTLLRHAGADLADAGLAPGGWSLQRLGETPFDSSRSAGGLAIRDGEILYLRPRQAQLPELAFDDVIDAIATASRSRPGRWQDSTTRWFGLTSAAVVLFLAALILARSGPSWLAPSLVSGGVAAGLAVAAAVLSRALGDARSGVALGYAALPFAFLSGATASGGDTALVDFGALQLVTGSAALMAIAAVAAIAVADSVPGFAGVAAAAMVGTAVALLDLLTGLTGPGTAALAVTFVLAMTPLIPMVAFRLADLPLPFVPLSADDLRRDTCSVPGRDVLRRTAQADRFVTGMTGASAGLITGCEWLLCRPATGTAPWLVAVVAAAVALRARLFSGRLQRRWLLAAALGGLVLLAGAVADQHGQLVQLILVAVPLLVAAAALVLAALRVPGRRVPPFWGRTTDIVEALLVVAVLPMALAVVGLYGYLRGVTG